MILETERLFLREMRQNDFRDLAEILQNPNVMYAYEHDFSEDDVQVWLDPVSYTHLHALGQLHIQIRVLLNQDFQHLAYYILLGLSLIHI